MNTAMAARQLQNGVTRCNKGLGRNQCSACLYFTSTPNEVVKEVKVHSSGQVIKVEGKLNCKTTFLYILESSKSSKGPGDPLNQYVGQSGARVMDRLGQHRRSIENDDGSKVVPQHFYETGSTVRDLVFTSVLQFKTKNPWVRLHFERQFINEHGGLDKFINQNL